MLETETSTEKTAKETVPTDERALLEVVVVVVVVLRFCLRCFATILSGRITTWDMPTKG